MISQQINGRAVLQIGDKAIMETTESGHVSAADGIQITYDTGCIFIANDAGKVIGGLQHPDYSHELARRVIMGDKHALTDPHALLHLAAAYLAAVTKRHPDRGGSDAPLSELNGAYQQAQKEL